MGRGAGAGDAPRRLPPRRRLSVTAVRDGRSVDTTMGFTPLEGVPMATRAGRSIPAHCSICCATASAGRAGRGPGARVGAARTGGHRRRRGPRQAIRAPTRSWRSTSTATASPRRSPPWRCRSAASTHCIHGGVGEHSARVRAQVCARLDHLGVSTRRGGERRALRGRRDRTQLPRACKSGSFTRARTSSSLGSSRLCSPDRCRFRLSPTRLLFGGLQPPTDE